MGRLDHKIAVVTGGNSGIGLAAARRFAAEGAFVYITGRRAAELEQAAREIGDTVRAVAGDVSKAEDLDRLYAQVASEQGRLDIVLANAGGGTVAPLDQITEEQFDRTFAINVKGTLLTVQKALPLMRDGGSIILTGSTTGSMGTAAFSVYSASKAAVRNFARSWALDLKGRGIRVNVLSPGATATPGLHAIASDAEQREALLTGLAGAAPLGRIGKPDEIAAAALFLASDESSFMTGSELFVDGGLAQV